MFNKGINFNSGLNIYGTVVFSDRDCHKGATIVTNWQNDKRVLGIFSLRMRTNGYLGSFWGQIYKESLSASYELLMIRDVLKSR